MAKTLKAVSWVLLTVLALLGLTSVASAQTEETSASPELVKLVQVDATGEDVAAIVVSSDSNLDVNSAEFAISGQSVNVVSSEQISNGSSEVAYVIDVGLGTDEAQLEANISAVSSAIRGLEDSTRVSLIEAGSSARVLRSQETPAEAIEALSELSNQSESDVNGGIASAIRQLESDSLQKTIVLVTSGQSSVSRGLDAELLQTQIQLVVVASGETVTESVVNLAQGSSGFVFAGGEISEALTSASQLDRWQFVLSSEQELRGREALSINFGSTVLENGFDANVVSNGAVAVSYTHLTLPTNREV